MGRNNTAEVELRRNDVYTLLLEGKSLNEVLAHCAKRFGVKRSTVEKDMIAVRKSLLNEYHKEKQEIIAIHTQRYENLYRFYMERGDDAEGTNIHFNPETASKMLEKKEKLLRLHNADVVINNNTMNICAFSHLTVEEIKEALNDDE